ncbi:MAG: hypothetical protein WAV48_02200 [Candidatus Magasanikiibacteriota bacterium]
MTEKTYEEVKESVLAHMQGLFEEMEEDMAMSHQEKYALLEDMFENASDADELRVAFEQWYVDHAEDLGLEHDADELWDQALGGEINYDNYNSDDEEIVETVDTGLEEKEDDIEEDKEDY